MKSVTDIISERHPGLEFTLDDMCYQGFKTVKPDPDKPGFGMDAPELMISKEEWDICVELAKVDKEADAMIQPLIARTDYVAKGGTDILITEDGWVTKRKDPHGRVDKNNVPTRALGYKNMADQMDQLYHDMENGKNDKTGEWYKSIKAVKDAFPKPE